MAAEKETVMNPENIPVMNPANEIVNAVKLVADLVLPGTSLLLQGKIPQGGAHAILGVLACKVLGRVAGPVGWVLLAANAYSKSTSGSYLHDYVVDLFSKPTKPGDTHAEEPAVEEKPAVEPLPSGHDDLTRLEGIGPKISVVLQDQGIATFAQLAKTGVNRLRQILREANLRMADPSTWPKQAKLAAADQWEALDALQKQLTGGRSE